MYVCFSDCDIPIDLELEIPEIDGPDSRLRSEIVIPHDLTDQPSGSNELESAVLDEPGPSGGSCIIAEPLEPLLDDDILEILGIDPTTNTKYGKDINKDLAIRFQHYSITGLSKDTRKELGDKYPIPSNCKFIDAPQLNPEIKAALTEPIAKRDKNIEARQKQVATALSCLSDALTTLFSATNKDTNLIRSLMDTSRILCDCQYNDSVTRRNFILSSLKKEMKEQLQNTKVDSFLFGENLSETLKAARAINKSGAELKGNPSRQNFAPKKPTPGPSKNWKTPYATKKPPVSAQKMRDPANAPKNRPSNSYKQSQPRQHNSGNRR